MVKNSPVAHLTVRVKVWKSEDLPPPPPPHPITIEGNFTGLKPIASFLQISRNTTVTAATTVMSELAISTNFDDEDSCWTDPYERRIFVGGMLW